VKNFVFYSTLFSVFTEAFLFNVGFDIKLFYLVVLVNIIIFIVFNSVVYSKGLLVFHAVILFSGLYSCIFGYNDFGYFFIQFFFLLLIPIYYYTYFTYFEDRTEEIVFIYCKICFILAIIGFLKLPYDISIGRSLDSLLLEPAHYCTVVLPAYFITLKEQRFPRYYFVIILLSIIVSGSSLGIIGIGVSMILYSKRISFVKASLSFLFVVLIGGIVYTTFEPFKLRLDDTVNSSVNRDLSEANLSTYALLSNFYVSTQSLLSNPLIGNGIGSHINSRKLYLGSIEGIEVFEKMEMDTLNAQDAGSLFSRVMSELGLVGLFGMFYFIWKFYVPITEKNLSFNTIVSRGILLYFFAKLFREGHYFSPEMYFFVFLYVFIKYRSIESKNINIVNAQ
jgi:hypothetical protein